MPWAEGGDTAPDTGHVWSLTSRQPPLQSRPRARGSRLPRESGPDPLSSPSHPTGSPGPPRDVAVTKSASELTLRWSEGHTGRAPTTGYVIEGRPSGKGGGREQCPQGG